MVPKSRTELTIIALFLCLLAGCVPTEMVVPSQDHSSYRKIDVSTYDIGKIQVKSVGEPMLIVASGIAKTSVIYRAAKTLRSPMHEKFSVILGIPNIKEDSIWTLHGTIKNGDKFYASESVPSNYCLVSNQQNEFYSLNDCQYFYRSIMWQEKIPGLLKAEKITTYKAGALKQEFHYTGKSKDTIKLQYREYNEDFIRPSFSQELSYDLSESKEIGFRGMTIDILEATNSKIKFIIKSKMF